MLRARVLTTPRPAPCPARSNRTYTFAALLQLLRDPPADVQPELLPKFYDLVGGRGCACAAAGVGVVVGGREGGRRNRFWLAACSCVPPPPASPGPPTPTPTPSPQVVKCLIKLTKGLQAAPGACDLAALLFCLHDFFLFLGVDEIRQRSSADDKPLRMVKTILHELCKMLVGGGRWERGGAWCMDESGAGG